MVKRLVMASQHWRRWLTTYTRRSGAQGLQAFSSLWAFQKARFGLPIFRATGFCILFCSKLRLRTQDDRALLADSLDANQVPGAPLCASSFFVRLTSLCPFWMGSPQEGRNMTNKIFESWKPPLVGGHGSPPNSGVHHRV